MAQFLNEREEQEIELQEGEELANFDEPETGADNSEPATNVNVEDNTDDDIPDKYKGKDIKEIIRMHSEAEKMIGKHSSEVGELRKVVDDFVNSQLVNNAPAEQEEDEEIDFYADPERAIAKAIENHPSLKQAQQATQAIKQQEIQARLKNAHPDFMTIVQDPAFGEWVGKSKVRRRLLEDADQRFDFDAADELLSNWKERQNILAETKQAEHTERKRSVKNASTGSTKGSGEGRTRKVYRRADIIRLMQTDPARYQSMAQEIRQAYAEGRVKS